MSAPTIRVTARICRKCGSVVWPKLVGPEGRQVWAKVCPAIVDGRQCKTVRWSEPASAVGTSGRRPLTPAQRAERALERAQARYAAVLAEVGQGDAPAGLG